MKKQSAKCGDGTLGAAEWRAVDLRIVRVGGQDALLISLDDGRLLALPLWLYPTLASATPMQRKAFELISGGRGVSWPGLDLDLSVRGMLLGTPEMTVTAARAARRLDLRGYSRALAAATRMRKAG